METEEGKTNILFVKLCEGKGHFLTKIRILAPKGTAQCDIMLTECFQYFHL